MSVVVHVKVSIKVNEARQSYSILQNSLHCKKTTKVKDLYL